MHIDRLRTNTDLAAGLLFAALGASFCAASLFGLKIGSAFRMGPGFFPAAVGGLLLLIGVAIAINALRSNRHEAAGWGTVPWRAVLAIPTGLVLFGLAVRPLGLVPALLLLCLLASLGIKGMSPVRILALSLAITALCVGVFSFGLGMKLPLLGDWLR